MPVRRHRYERFVTLQISHFCAYGICPNELIRFTSDDSRQRARQWHAVCIRVLLKRGVSPKEHSLIKTRPEGNPLTQKEYDGRTLVQIEKRFATMPHGPNRVEIIIGTIVVPFLAVFLAKLVFAQGALF